MRDFHYKCFPIFCLFLCVCLFSNAIVLVHAASSKDSKHIPTGRMLEFSLKNLKDSLQKTKQRNNELKIDNAQFRKDIQHRKYVLRNLSSKKSELLGQSAQFNHEGSAIESFDSKERRRRAQGLVDVFERDVSSLQQQIQQLDEEYDQSKFDLQRQLLLAKEKESKEVIAMAEKRVRRLQGEEKGPLKTIEKLQNHKDRLVDELRLLEEKAGRLLIK